MPTVRLALLAPVGAALLLIAGCAGVPEAAPAARTTAAGSQPGSSREVLTGSRIARPGTDRIVRAIDNQTYRDENRITSIGNEVGARGN
jgi:hypothetical protein